MKPNHGGPKLERIQISVLAVAAFSVAAMAILGGLSCIHLYLNAKNQGSRDIWIAFSSLKSCSFGLLDRFDSLRTSVVVCAACSKVILAIASKVNFNVLKTSQGVARAIGAPSNHFEIVTAPLCFRCQWSNSGLTWGLEGGLFLLYIGTTTDMVTELMAIGFGLMFVWERGGRHLILESDSLEAINLAKDLTSE
ncbi:Ribonuclease H domain [Dillenia turbinata]|uniref:Ribonuclease H domain n=1 Tax=Dillenia turbinata TaxID=194707 RepID=A0AAN8UUF4_9MAGN